MNELLLAESKRLDSERKLEEERRIGQENKNALLAGIQTAAQRLADQHPVVRKLAFGFLLLA